MDIDRAIELHEKLLALLELEMGHDEFYILITMNSNGKMMIEIEEMDIYGSN